MRINPITPTHKSPLYVRNSAKYINQLQIDQLNQNKLNSAELSRQLHIEKVKCFEYAHSLLLKKLEQLETVKSANIICKESDFTKFEILKQSALIMLAQINAQRSVEEKEAIQKILAS